MDRGFWVNVFNGDATVIFKNKFGRNLFIDYFLKKRFFHKSILLRFFGKVESVNGTTDAHELRVLLKIEGNCSSDLAALLEYTLNNVLFAERALFLKQQFDDVGHGSVFKAPFFEGVKSSAHQNELGVANEFVVNGLNGDAFHVEFGIGNFLGDFHKVQRLVFNTKHNQRFITNALGVDVSPYHESVTFFQTFDAFIDLQKGGEELFRQIISVRMLGIL